MRLAVAAAAMLVLGLPGSVRAVGEPLLIGTVRDNFTIDLKHPNGDLVTTLAPGAYDFEIRDQTSDHNFHLQGQDVDKLSGVDEVATVIWEDVVLAASSTYTFVCDPHSDTMRGSFTTGASPPPPPPPGPPPPGPPPPSPPAPPPPHAHVLQVASVRISIERRGARRLLLARARINHAATAKLALVRQRRTRLSTRKPWAAGPNSIRLGLPRSLAPGRWTAVLQVGTQRFRRIVRIG
jgi:hypothetical protein